MIIQSPSGNTHLLQDIAGTCVIKALVGKKHIRRIQYFISALFRFLYHSHCILLSVYTITYSYTNSKICSLFNY